MATLRKIFFVLLVTWAKAARCFADEPPPFAEARDESDLYAVETVIANLDNPASVAVRPGWTATGPFELYIAESGAGQVVRLMSDNATSATPAVTGFPLKRLDGDPGFEVGPLGLEFLSRNRLAVGTGGLGAGADLVRVYALPDDNAAIPYEKADHSAGPVAPGSRSKAGEGVFFSLAKTDKALFVAPHSGDDQGWILKALLDANRAAALEPAMATRATAGVPSPAAVTVDPRPQHHYLVVGQRGLPTAERDSRLTMYSPTSGAVALNLNAGLRDIFALAYSPTGDLYAADFSSAQPDEGGVFRLEAARVDGRESCRAVKIAGVVRPTALAFTADGALYVTAFGARSDDDRPSGALLKVTPRENTPKL
jgi:hypothetical protein